MDYDLNKLTEAIRRKTNKVIELKDECDVKKYKCKMVGMICILPVIYIFFFSDRMANYFMWILGENISVDSITAMFDGAIISVLIVGSFILYWLYKDYIKAIRKYEAIRTDILSNIETGICSCHRKCSCDDEYIKFMESHGVDVVFK